MFALDAARVVKLDRPEFDGLSTYEAEVARAVHAAGLPVPEVIETVTIDGRHGVVLERLHGPRLTDVVRGADDVAELAVRFVELHLLVNSVDVEVGGPLEPRLADEVRRSGLPDDVVAELVGVVEGATGPRGLCHFDLHPDNVVVTEAGWRVIDWLTVAHGPTDADFARTLLLWGHVTEPSVAAFMRVVRAEGATRRGIDEGAAAAWRRVVAAARMAEGFDGPYLERLRDVALGG